MSYRLLYALIPDLPAERWAQLSLRIPPIVLASLQQTRQPLVFRQRLVARLLLLKIATDPTLLETIHYTEQGKPGHPDLPPFSIAHSANMVLLAVGNWSVDVEHRQRRIQPTHFTDFLHPDEQLALAQTADPTALLLQGWVKKEALSKQLGLGLSLPFREVSVLKGAAVWGQKAFFFQDHSALHPDYWIYTCSEEPVEYYTTTKVEIG